MMTNACCAVLVKLAPAVTLTARSCLRTGSLASSPYYNGNRGASDLRGIKHFRGVLVH